MSLSGVRVGGQYRCQSKVGSGSFGEIYIGLDEATGSEVAIKMEAVNSRRSRVFHEAKIYKMLAGSVGIPRVHWYGTEGGHNAMVIDLLGPSLADLFAYCNRRFNVKTVLMLADQMLSRIEYVHAKNLVHRDIKPDNFVIGLGVKANQVHMIDFGLSKMYRDPKTLEHVPFTGKHGFTGTARYASVNSHLGFEQSRRDDLEAVGYVLMYFLRGRLPWQGFSRRDLADLKIALPVEELCEGYPREFSNFVSYCRDLQFDQRPDYAFLRRMLKQLFFDSGYEYDFVFSWTTLSRCFDSDDEESEHRSDSSGGEVFTLPSEPEVQLARTCTLSQSFH
eukprot:TRINITY_DN4332_c0_g2_i2.p1 TRINITY_DN4332_c0_g2~~TRINITY_DN4332_c0_g2_i2.p1  ORF type:complete len:334 (+),score=52.43 TRINITY_DN4332_c0_g2_i2:49-1050(+)